MFHSRCSFFNAAPRGFFLATTALTLAGPVMAQEVPEAAQLGEVERIEAITVYGTSNPIPAFEYPGQVSVVTRDDFDTLAPSAISDALRDIPGLEFSGGPRRTGETPSLRGLSGQNVLILLDGARQSFISAHDGQFFVDPDLIGRAEVVKGPASALYGSGAVGGVLAFESVDAQDMLRSGETWGARVRLGYQSVNDESLASVTAFTRQGRFDGVASFGMRQSGDIKLGSGADLPSEDDIQTALLKGSFEATEALTVEGSWQRFTNTAIEPNNGQGGVMGTGDSVLDREVEKDIETDTFRLGLSFDPLRNDWIDASLTAYRTTSIVDEFDKTIPRTTLRDVETTGISLRNASRFMLGPVDTVLTVGGDWYEDEQVGRDDQAIAGIRGGVPDGRSKFTGVFAQLESSLETDVGEFLFIPGLRYDEFESSSSITPGADNSDDALNLRFAASYGPADWVRAFGSYAEGFRAPSINELYLDGVHFEVPHPVLFNPRAGQFVFVTNNFVANPNLIPEETETIEFGLGFDFAAVLVPNDRLQAKVSYYESDVANLIDLSVDFAYDPSCFVAPSFFPCSAGLSNSANVDAAKLEGVEAELSYDSTRAFAQMSFSSVNGTNLADGSDLGSLTPDRIALNLGVKVPEWTARFGTRVQYASDFERLEAAPGGGLTIAETRDDYAVLDLYATWQPEFLNGVRIDAGIDNVFDTDYARVFEGVSEPGRNIRVALSYQFGN